MNQRLFALRFSTVTKVAVVIISFLIAAAAMAQAPANGPGKAAGSASTAPARPLPSGGFGGFGFPPPLPAGVKAERNIPYVVNGDRNQVMDIFMPEKPSDKPLPLMIWIHGGGWIGGDQHNPPVLFLVNNGFIVASIQHRFSSEAKWPAQAYDVKAAIRFLRANAAKYNFDPDQVGLGGDSSGGHLAAFAGTSGDVKSMEGDLGNPGYSTRVQAVVDWFGPTDFTQMAAQSPLGSFIQHNDPNSPESMLLGGAVQKMKDLAETANPITYITRSEPPFLIMHGDKDMLVPWGQSDILAKALIDAGNEVTMKTLHGAGHEDPQFRSPENQHLILDFLTVHLKTVE